MKRTWTILLCITLLTGLVFAAPPGMPPGMPPGGGPGGPGGEAYGSFAANSPTAALILDDGALSAGADFTGTIQAAGAGLEGIHITGSGTDNGLVIRETRGNTVALGGAADVYDTDGDGKADYNTVIQLTGAADDPNVEGKYATALLVDAAAGQGLLTVDNALIRTSGYRAPGLLSTATDFGVAFRGCRMEAAGGAASFMPNFKLMVGSARATCLMSQNTWLYNTAIQARDWGAVSLDTTPDADVYMVNSCAEADLGGYGLYAVNGTRTNLYGSRLAAAQYGMFLMGNGAVHMEALERADEAALAQAGDCDLSVPLFTDGRSFAGGLVNAVVVHVNSGVGAAGLQYPATLTLANSVLSTLPEDVISTLGGEMAFRDFESYLLAPIKDQGASWFYLKHCEGSLIAVRSAGVTVTIGEGCDLRPANGVLLHTLIGYDSDAGNIYNDSSLANAAAISPVTLNVNAPAQGDILHEDYQRAAYLNLNAAYTGRIVSGTQESWNALWSDAALSDLLADAGYTEDQFSVPDNGSAIRGWLIRETGAYPAVYGAAVRLADGITWNVTGTSSLSSLTLGAGSQVCLPQGYEIYVNCNAAYSYLSGERLEGLEAGKTYNMVVIAKPTGFTDVTGEDACCDAVMEATTLGLVSGLPGGSFGADQDLTMAQAVKLAVSAWQLRNGDATVIVNGEPWYENYVNYARDQGLLGEDVTDFDAPVTYAQLAPLLEKALGVPVPTTELTGPYSRGEAAALLMALYHQA